MSLLEQDLALLLLGERSKLHSRKNWFELEEQWRDEGTMYSLCIGAFQDRELLGRDWVIQAFSTSWPPGAKQDWWECCQLHPGARAGKDWEMVLAIPSGALLQLCVCLSPVALHKAGDWP